MMKEYWVLGLLWIVGIMTFWSVARNRLPIAIFSLLICQALTWLNTLLHVKFHLLAFPVREFPKATDLLFTTEYFFYPVICTVCYLFESRRSRMSERLLTVLFFISLLTLIDGCLERYTDLVEYLNYGLFWTWLDFIFIYYISRCCTNWFFKDVSHFQADWRAT
jgi:hypothetical protein